MLSSQVYRHKVVLVLVLVMVALVLVLVLVLVMALVLVLVLVLVMVCFRCKRNNYFRGNCNLRLPLLSKSHCFQYYCTT
jgi:uncharacterized membrane protein